MAMLRVSEIIICLKVHLFFFPFFAILEEPLPWLGQAGAGSGMAGPTTHPLTRPKSEK